MRQTRPVHLHTTLRPSLHYLRSSIRTHSNSQKPEKPAPTPSIPSITHPTFLIFPLSPTSIFAHASRRSVKQVHTSPQQPTPVPAPSFSFSWLGGNWSLSEAAFHRHRRDVHGSGRRGVRGVWCCVLREGGERGGGVVGRGRALWWEEGGFGGA